MMTEYSGVDRSGKTTLAVGDMIRLWQKSYMFPGGFRPSDFWGNTAVFFEGYHHVESDDLLERMTYALTKKDQHIGFFFDEATAHIPARGYGDKQQRELVKLIWQNEKLFQRFYIVSNTGNSLDTIIDQSFHMTMLPRYVEEEDSIFYWVCFRRQLIANTWVVRNVRDGIQRHFNSWQPVL